MPKSIYPQITTIDAVYSGYRGFRSGKRKAHELLAFDRNREDNLAHLQTQLYLKSYRPGPYTVFYINDPKVRLIHKASIIDRIVHHIVSKKLESIFEPIFISYSYSCRQGKGTHKGVRDLIRLTRSVSRNNTRSCYGLKCDVKKFFASVDHTILFEILRDKLTDPDFIGILKLIIDSFDSGIPGKGLPIGNLTSQYFANIYLNRFDQYVKHTLKIKYYLRYTDDFIILSESREYLLEVLEPIRQYLINELCLELHPQKIKLLDLKNGIDFLGYVIFPHHILPRNKTVKRIRRKMKERLNNLRSNQISRYQYNQSVQSYLGYLKHSNSYCLAQELKNQGSKD